ncbi:hypothetical protein C7S14_2941 [Burkholderia cepacia]|nr:hypothetical protein C7S14_2941 [Burkholderia cepacia]
MLASSIYRISGWRAIDMRRVRWAELSRQAQAPRMGYD